MIDAEELAALQAEVEELTLTDTCDVLRKGPKVRNPEGGFTDSWQAVHTYPCSLTPSGLTPSEREIAARLGAPVTWNVRVPVSSDVRPTDRLAVLGHTLNVVAVLGPRTLEITRKILCVEVS